MTAINRILRTVSSLTQTDNVWINLYTIIMLGLIVVGLACIFFNLDLLKNASIHTGL